MTRLVQRAAQHERGERPGGHLDPLDADHGRRPSDPEDRELAGRRLAAQLAPAAGTRGGSRSLRIMSKGVKRCRRRFAGRNFGPSAENFAREATRVAPQMFVTPSVRAAKP